MHQGLKLVEADRASLFLVDQKTMQLYARIFGVTGEMDGEEIRQVDAAAQGKLRFPLVRIFPGFFLAFMLPPGQGPGWTCCHQGPSSDSAGLQ